MPSVNGTHGPPPSPPPPPGHCLQEVKLPFKKFKLYLKLNMIGKFVRSHNLDHLITVRFW